MEHDSSPEAHHADVVIHRAARAPEHAAAVTARDVVRRYGEGDTAVDALRGVSLDDRAGRLTAVMGPRLRQVDADAHPRRASTARRRAGLRRRDEITRLDDTR
jgi:hypothetical protein